jgi:phosphate/sulfate permease
LVFFSPEPVKIAKKITPYLVFFVFMILTLAMIFKGLKNLKLDLGFTEAFLVACLVGGIAAFVSYFLVQRIKLTKQNQNYDLKQPAELGKKVQKALRQLKKAATISEGQMHSEISVIMGDLATIENDLSRKLTISRNSSDYKTVERIFVYLQILSAGFVAFAHGANDVANAVGPLAGVISILQTGTMAAKSVVPLWVLGLGGIGIVIGLSTWGWRVMATIGKKITELTPSRGFCAEFAAAITIVLASKIGIPISTTHTLVGGVLGVGFARGINALNLKVITNIVISWIITIPVGALGAILFYYILHALFGQG